MPTARSIGEGEISHKNLAASLDSREKVKPADYRRAKIAFWRFDTLQTAFYHPGFLTIQT